MFEEKLEKLETSLDAFGSVLVAFSGGVDSSVLAGLSHKLLGMKAVAVTVDSSTLAASELECAKKVAAEIGITHLIAKYDELADEDFASNPEDRCYYCKSGLFRILREVAEEHGIDAILEGTTVDELEGHRPGYKAVREHGIFTPLADAGFTKDDVRALARLLGLSNSEKPSTACLSSRIPAGTRITEENLRAVEAAEDFLRGLGVGQVRVRHIGDAARIEVLESDFHKVMKNRNQIAERFQAFGFRNVSLDLKGYRTGNLSGQPS
ncbi:MAG: ATP-dependent sacrificial sulfur transferase LarE [Candidatus Altiarchaeota archaeon]